MITTESVESFCERHDACVEGKKWALKNCSTMNDVWEQARAEWLIWVATRPGVLDDKTLILFSCWCVHQVWGLLTDERSRHVVNVAEKFSHGEASREDLAAAEAAALAAADAAAESAAKAAALFVAWAAALSDALLALAAAKAAALVAADAEESAALVAVAATRVVSRSATREAQAKWLRKNAKPNFELPR